MFVFASPTLPARKKWFLNQDASVLGLRRIKTSPTQRLGAAKDLLFVVLPAPRRDGEEKNIINHSPSGEQKTLKEARHQTWICLISIFLEGLNIKESLSKTKQSFAVSGCFSCPQLNKTGFTDISQPLFWKPAIPKKSCALWQAFKRLKRKTVRIS